MPAGTKVGFEGTVYGITPTDTSTSFYQGRIDAIDFDLMVFQLHVETTMNFTATPMAEQVEAVSEKAAVTEEYLLEYVKPSGHFFNDTKFLGVVASAVEIFPPLPVTMAPTVSAMPSGSYAPSVAPSVSAVPSKSPSQSPSDVPSSIPSQVPSNMPSASPSQQPTDLLPSASPSATPSAVPSQSPSSFPTLTPTLDPTVGTEPSAVPTTMEPTISPTIATTEPTPTPTMAPTEGTDEPTPSPTIQPTPLDPDFGISPPPTLLDPNFGISPPPTRLDPDFGISLPPTPLDPGFGINPPLTKPGCSEDDPCSSCQGDCDNDEECQSGLVCFYRPGNSIVDVPGCAGSGIPGADYCVTEAADTLRIRRPTCSQDNPCSSCQGVSMAFSFASQVPVLH